MTGLLQNKNYLQKLFGVFIYITLKKVKYFQSSSNVS
jgi:hypothetical protein